MKTITMITMIIIYFNYNLNAQVTIGCTEEPEIGALLQLKDQTGAGAGANASKGLGLPLVSLIANSSLEPCVTDEASKRIEHTGLVVYNVGEEVLTSIEDRLCKGLHVWNGNKWTPFLPYPKISDEFAIVECQPGPEYTLSCTDTQVSGMYRKAQALDNSHNIRVKIPVGGIKLVHI
ncbi:MAG: hypothetical protein ACK5M3_02595 [Dysgonomonas sp.]